MKNLFLLASFITGTIAVNAQKKSFDIVSFIPPQGWNNDIKDDYVSYSRIDGSSWSQIAVYKSRQSSGSIKDDAQKDWEDLVLKGHTIEQEETTESKTAEGWQVMSRSGIWQYNGTNVATLLTTYSNEKICISVLWNGTAQPYMNNLKDFIASIDLDANTIQAQQQNSSTQSAGNNTVNNATKTASAVVGLWTDYILETTGYNINGMPQYTAGYLRKEYSFYPDGTYLFRNQQWLTKTKDILFIYETGTYEILGNQLTITPKNGEGGFWQKTASTKEWGKLVNASEYKLEKITYSFKIENDSSYGNKIILTSSKPTQRDGGKFNAPNEPFEFRYNFRNLESSIDNPPGFKTGFENKSLTAVAQIQTNNPIAGNTINSPIAGKIWEGSSTEKFLNEGSTNYNTGGFTTTQYKFNTDGTYRFVYVSASHFTDTKTLGYETGTYTIISNQLIINPTQGQNEEWTKNGKTSNGNSDVANRTINDSWNKKLKTTSRKLENYTYTFSIEKNGDKTALILQRNGSTERDGDGNSSFLNETSLERSVKLPGNIK